jgi:hypothetical protein
MSDERQMELFKMDEKMNEQYTIVKNYGYDPDKWPGQSKYPEVIGHITASEYEELRIKREEIEKIPYTGGHLG